jgi:hypothetical protein
VSVCLRDNADEQRRTSANACGPSAQARGTPAQGSTPARLASGRRGRSTRPKSEVSPSIDGPTNPHPERRRGQARSAPHRARRAVRPWTEVRAPAVKVEHEARVRGLRVRQSSRGDCIAGSRSRRTMHELDGGLYVTTGAGLGLAHPATAAHVPAEQQQRTACVNHGRIPALMALQAADVEPGRQPGLETAVYAASSSLSRFTRAWCQTGPRRTND